MSFSLPLDGKQNRVTEVEKVSMELKFFSNLSIIMVNEENQDRHVINLWSFESFFDANVEPKSGEQKCRGKERERESRVEMVTELVSEPIGDFIIE